ncbi:MAG: TetR family transcriptional regulator [Deltaproteobacteria bacterium]|jgi:AcrR family transcriptional regulator|nr:TetR family transcriptional regulator [Deltaproteobacteria bacterium]
MPRNLSGEEVEAFRERLRAVAERQFAERGFDGVSLRSITDELGCSRMTPYRYFRDKADIFAAVRTSAYLRFAAAQEKAAAEAGEPVGRLTALGQAYYAFALSQPNAYRLMFELSQPDADEHPELREAEARAWAPIRDGIDAAVEAGVLAGDVDVLAHSFWAGVHGIVSLHLAGKLVHGVSVDELAEPMLLQLFRGALPD